VKGLALLVALLTATSVPASAEPLRRLTGTVPRTLARLTDVGAAPADLPLEHVIVYLGLRNRSTLDALIAAQQDPRSPLFRRWLEPTEIADRFGARPVRYERARRWLSERGFRIVGDSPYRAAIVVAGTAAQAEAAFASPMRLYRRAGRVHHAPASDPVLPASLGVRGILGLDDLPKFRPLVQADTDSLAMAPHDFAVAYDVTALQGAGLTGAGTSIAVIARSNFRDEDLRSFAVQFGNPPALAPIRVLAGTDPGVLTREGEETEVLLDAEWAGALAPSTQVRVVIGTLAGDIPEALVKAVADRSGDIISISFGLCEPQAPTVATEVFDGFYAIANAQGQTVLVSSGDDGAQDCSPSSEEVAVNALAASPHAVAVGGTSLFVQFDTTGNVMQYLGETVWNDDHGAGGGGQSTVFARPRFQIPLGLGFRGRVLPDLALAAAPGTVPVGDGTTMPTGVPGYVVVQGQRTRVVGGTSAGTPALASILSLVGQQIGGGGLGQLLPSLYRLGNEQARGLRAPVFRDVTVGSNGFSAGPGFDLASGFGSPIPETLAAGIANVGPALCEPELGCLVPAQGSKRHACAAEWLVERTGIARSRRGIPLARQHCRDGDPACDLDGVADGRCTVSVGLCLNVFDTRVLHPRGPSRGLPLCEPGELRRVRILGPSGGPTTRLALATALDVLPELPTTLRQACTTTVPVTIPLRPGGRQGQVTLRARAEGHLGTTTNRITLTCSAH
jgi:kumamolisin